MQEHLQPGCILGRPNNMAMAAFDAVVSTHQTFYVAYSCMMINWQAAQLACLGLQLSKCHCMLLGAILKLLGACKAI